jgi:IPT/TIG domain
MVTFRLTFLRLAIACLGLVVLLANGCGGTSSSPSSPPAQGDNAVPTISSVTPATTTAGAAQLSIAISGSSFMSGSQVRWNGAAIATTFSTGSSLSATVPGADLADGGMAAITVFNPAPGGGASAAANFTVNNPPPVIATVDPASVAAGSAAQTLDLTGTGFVPSSTVEWNGAALATLWVSATELKATLPASAIAGSSATTVTVQNPAPGGGKSAPAPYTVTSPRPVLSSISPQIVPAGQAATITLTGTGFETNSIVEWNGAPRTTAFVSATMLQVSLSAADLQNVKTGTLTVTNPGPDSATSGSQPLATTNQPFPTITSVSVGPAPNFGLCPQLQIAVTGKNFYSESSIQVNGIPLQNITYGGDLTTLINNLPPGLATKPGGLSVTVSDPRFPPLVSEPFVYPATSPTVLAICPNPSPATVYPKSSFTIAVQPTEVNATGTEKLSIGSLPAGLSVTNSTVPMPSTGAELHFKAAASLAAGNYTIPLQATAGQATASGNLALTVSTGTVPGFNFSPPQSSEVAVPIGGSGSITFDTFNPGVDYDITPSVSGLPAGTSASFSPTPFSAGQSVTVTITAAANAPVTQNATVTLTGTPSASVAPATSTFYVDVTQPPGSLPNSRTDFTPTWGTLYGAVYDRAHDLIFASNADWGRVDVLSNKTHKLVKSISVPNPRGVDISPDNTTVWVATQSQLVFKIDTAQLSAVRNVLPLYQNQSWQGNQIEALADGTVLLAFSHITNDGSFYSAIWNPSNNVLTGLTVPSGSQPGLGFGPWTRSGDGSKSYSFSADSSNCQVLEYDVATKSVTPTATINEVCGFYAVNQDGSRIVAANGAAVGMYDGSFHLLGTIFPNNPAVIGYFSGSFVFSKDGNTLYEISGNKITTIETASVTAEGTAPAIAPGDQFWYGSAPPPGTPFAIDANGMMLDIQPSGIGFEDTTFFQKYGTNTVPQPSAVTLSTYSGPLSGGTEVSPYGYFGLTPDVWFGGARGTASLNGTNTLTVISPPSSTPGPVNLKYLFPDGAQLFTPQVFTYSVFPQYAILSGGSADGGEPGRISGYGLPTDPSNGSMTVGENSATITTKTSQYLPFTGEAFPATYLNFTVPPGSPGFADIDVTTSAGTGTLAKGFFYARSVKDYPSSDKFTAVLADTQRQRVYLAAKSQIDVFSASSSQYTAPMYPAAQGAAKQFSGLALTPDGTQLIATDLLDGSIAVVNPDAPSSTFAIPIAPVDYSINNCANGPIYVAATSDHRAFVTTGSLPAPSCAPEGILYIANLQSRTAAQPSPVNNPCHLGGTTTPFADADSADASTDGNYVAIGTSALDPGCLYSVAQNSYLPFAATPGGYEISIAGDANVMASSNWFSDMSGNLAGNIAQPPVFYPTNTTNLAVALYRPLLNDSGSLYYIAYPNYFEVIDVLHARLLMRFSLTETVQSTASPIAIDTGGRYVYLITDKGLTVVDLGEAPLAIGHLSQQTAGAGTQVKVRGSGFDASVTATVGGEPASVSVTDENTLTLTVPAVASGPEDIVLVRSDGATYTYESGLTIP